MSPVEPQQQPPHCVVCRLPTDLCVCRDLPQYPLPLGFLLLQHVRERRSSSNTGNLVRKVLPNSSIVAYGRQGAPFDPKRLTDVDGAAALLYPSPDAVALSADRIAVDEVTTLVVLDATWPQARRMFQRLPPLRRLPAWCLPQSRAPRWQLRKQRQPGHLSTAGAVASALEVCGYPEAAATLDGALAAMTRAHLLRRRRNLRG